MYNHMIQLMKQKAFTYEYSVNTIKYHALYDLTDSQREMLKSYGDDHNFDPEGFKYHKEVSKCNADGSLVYARIEFINPDTGEELIFIWEDPDNEN